MANYAPPQNDGRSVAFNSDGTLIVQGGSAEEVVPAELDLVRLHTWQRSEAGRAAARSPETYAAISLLTTRGH